MRASLRTTGIAPLALVGVLGLLATTGCAGDHAAEPTVASVNFSPRLVLEVDEGGLAWRSGPRGTDADLSHPEVANGTVIQVVNTGREAHRVRGDTWFDTGSLEPGERVDVVLDKTTTEPKTLDVTVRGEPDHKATIVVRATPTAT